MRLRSAILAAALLLGTLPALAQGCAMCYESAKGASGNGKNALSRAVAVLLFPTLSLMGGIAGLTLIYTKRRDG